MRVTRWQKFYVTWVMPLCSRLLRHILRRRAYVLDVHTGLVHRETYKERGERLNKEEE